MQEEKSPIDYFPSRLSLAIEENGLKPADLSRLTSLSKTAISNYLKGDRKPGAEELYKIALALGKKMEWLMGDGEESVSDRKQKKSNESTQILQMEKENGSNMDDLTSARLEITRLRNKLKSATQTLEGAYKLALEALKLEE